MYVALLYVVLHLEGIHLELMLVLAGYSSQEHTPTPPAALPAGPAASSAAAGSAGIWYMPSRQLHAPWTTYFTFDRSFPRCLSKKPNVTPLSAPAHFSTLGAISYAICLNSGSSQADCCLVVSRRRLHTKVVATWRLKLETRLPCCSIPVVPR